jgi:DUF4097 and DUF4098 domain-containing protein YvlB
MNTLTRSFLTAAALAVSASIATARIDRTVEKTFPVTGTGSLKVDTQGGEIRITPSSDSVVKITVKQKIRANTDAEADELLKKLELVLEQNGNDVVAPAKYERQPAGFRWGSWPPVNVDFVISMPAAFATDLHTSGGPITVGDVNGKVKARTSGGPIALGRIGAPVDARTSGGPITLAEAKGDVNLDTSGGNISVGKVEGAADLSTSGGGIKIESVVNTLRAHTSGGSIRAGILGPLKDDCELSTSGGGVRVTVDKAAAFKLDASTSGGDVDAEGLTLTLEKGRGRSRLAGNVNGGGPLLKLRTSGGDIEVRTR